MVFAETFGSASPNVDVSSSMFRGFSHPGEQQDAGLRDLLVVEHARETLRRFLAKFDRELDDSTIGLRDYLTNLVDDGCDFESAWDISFGDCASSIGTGIEGIQPVRVAAALGLRFALAGHHGHWKARVPSGTRLLAGRGVLPACDHLTVEAGKRRKVAIRAEVNGTARKFVFDNGLPDQGGGEVEILPSLAIGRSHIVLLSRAALQSTGFDEERPRSMEVVVADVVADLEAAFGLLRRHAPAYVPWVRGVLRYVLPVKRVNPELLESGSSNRRPGVEVMSFPVTPAPCAELLVHESSHQYFYMLERMGPVDDGSDPTLYYSPIKQCGRPIRAILLAFHAFANVVLFYRKCRSSGADDGGYCALQEERLVPQLEELLKPLRASRALTPAGRGLWAPLAEAIEA